MCYEDYSDDSSPFSWIPGTLVGLFVLGLIMMGCKNSEESSNAWAAIPYKLIKIESKQIVATEDKVHYLIISDKETFDVAQENYSLVKVGKCYLHRDSEYTYILDIKEAKCKG